MIHLTTEQRNAIECTGTSVALSAGAGCGKTFVLTQRFIASLAAPNGKKSRPARLNQLIAITFTDAAAREMRSRIRQACYDELQLAKSAEAQQHWLRHLREIDSARISTIHAFCASLLRTHAAQAGLDPTFGVLDQTEADVLQYDITDDVLREQLENLDTDTLDLAAAFGLGRLKEQIAELLSHRHDEAFHAWLSETPDRLVANWGEWHHKYAVPNAAMEIVAAAPIESLLRHLNTADTSRKNEKFFAARAALLEILPRLERNENVTAADLERIRESAKVQGICGAKDWQATGSYDGYRDACKELRDLIDKYRPLPFDPQAAMETARLGLALVKLTDKVAAVYDNQKRAQGKLDFDDLLAIAFDLISRPANTELTKRMADDLRLLLVDEFQDTDELQANLVTKLCGPAFDAGRLFFVGDFKQSIYRFRGAEPRVFHEVRQKIAAAGRLPLTLNFRSQPDILHFVNALFCDTFRSEQEEYEKLRPDRKQLTDSPAVEFLWTITPDKNNHKSGTAQKARRQEAKSIAARLRQLIDDPKTKPVVDKHTGKPRQLQLGDIAVLFRTLGDVQAYEEALREYDLDYYLVGGYAFYAQQEIYDVLNLLRAVNSSADDLSLAGVLRSPFFALADETLFWLADAAGTLNAGLMANTPPPQLAPEEHAKVIAAADTLRHLRSIKDRVPIATLLNMALERTGYDAILLAEFLGERKLANLNKLIERARLLDQSGAADLDGFITQLSQFVVREPKESIAATLPEAANVVRLMTIHHAKGLEFPLVVVPDLDRAPNIRMPCAALHQTLGPLVPNPADDEGEKVTTGMTLYAALERREELEERKRLLYVACTRAADCLILSSSLEAFDKPRSDWMNLLASRFNLQTGDLLATLPPGYEPAAARVVTDPKSTYKTTGRARGPDLLKLLDEVHDLAANGDGLIPHEIDPISVDYATRHEFSFSRLTGALVRGEANIDVEELDGLDAEDQSPLRKQGVDAEPLLAQRASNQIARCFGNLVHAILSQINFADPDDLPGWCEHLARVHVVSDAQVAASTAHNLIERFTKSKCARQLATATALHREIDFILPWPGEADEQIPDKYIRGVIDCLYLDTENRWHILDFKTNDVPPAAIKREAQRYELQIYVYALAAERALGQPPAELTLHFLRPSQEHTFPWNDEARIKAIDLVTKAIASMGNSAAMHPGS